LGIINVFISTNNWDITKKISNNYFDKFFPSHISIVGAEYYHLLRYNNSKWSFKIGLLQDERIFSSLKPHLIEGSNGSIFLLDLMDQEVLDFLKKEVEEVWKLNGNGIIPIAVLGLNSTKPPGLKNYNNDINENSVNEEVENKNKPVEIFVTKLEINYTKYTLDIYWKKTEKLFVIKIFNDKQPLKEIEVNSSLTVDQAWEILNSLGIEVSSLSMLSETSEKIIQILQNPEENIKKKGLDIELPKYNFAYLGDIEDACIKFCKDLSKQTEKKGFNINYYAVDINKFDLNPFLEYLIASNRNRFSN